MLIYEASGLFQVNSCNNTDMQTLFYHLKFGFRNHSLFDVTLFPPPDRASVCSSLGVSIGENCPGASRPGLTAWEDAGSGAPAGRTAGSLCRSVRVTGGGDRWHPEQPLQGSILPGAATWAHQPGRGGRVPHAAGYVNRSAGNSCKTSAASLLVCHGGVQWRWDI